MGSWSSIPIPPQNIGVAKADLTAQSANVGPNTVYTVPATGAGTYRMSAYVVVTQAATTSSSTPTVAATYTDNDTNVASTTPAFVGANSTNTLGASSSAVAPAAESVTFQAKAGTVIQYTTAGYASVGATPMLYALHVKLEYLGS